MEKKDENTPSNVWTRRSSGKLNFSTNKSERESHEPPSIRRLGSASGPSAKNGPLNTPGLTPTNAAASTTASGASASFGLGSGAFASFGSAGKAAPKVAGVALDSAKPSNEKKDAQSPDSEEKEARRPMLRKSLSSLRPNPPLAEASKDAGAPWPLKHAWVIHYRPPTSKHSDYEKSIAPLCRVHTAQAFWQVYAHLKRPSALPTVSDYHFFKEGVRPVWEDEENKRGGKWTMRLKKGVADRYWEDLLLALVGDQFAEASDEVCGAVVSVRLGEDVFSVWTKNDGGRNIKIRETIKRVLALPGDTNLVWKSHDESITQRHNIDQARQEKAAYNDKRRNTAASIASLTEKRDGDANRT